MLSTVLQSSQLADVREHTFPYRLLIEPERVVFANLSASEARKANFLDHRHFRQPASLVQQPLGQIHRAAQTKQPRLHFIFHTAFCGSTLLSRCFDQSSRCTVLREPQILGDIAELRSGYAGWFNLKQLSGYVDLWGDLVSSWGGNSESIIVKPSNVVNCIMEDLMDRFPHSSATIISSSLDDFLVALLKRPAERFPFVRSLCTQLLQAFPHRPDYPYKPAELAANSLYAGALAWHMQQLFIDNALGRIEGKRVMRLNFPQFLSEPMSTLRQVSRHMQLDDLFPQDQSFNLAALQSNSKNTHERWGLNRREVERQEIRKKYSAELQHVMNLMNPALAKFPVSANAW